MKVAVIGYGSIGQRHAKNLRALGCGALAYDTDPAKDLPGPDEIDYAQYDAVVIATPYETHLEYAMQARHYSTPFFVEKPLGSIEQIESWREFASDPKLPLHQVGYQCRFHPDAITIKQREGKRVIDMKCHLDMRTWPGVYGDPLLECSHDIDLALWWGAPTTVDPEWSEAIEQRPHEDWFRLKSGGQRPSALLWFRYQEECPWMREWSCDGTPNGYQTAFWKERPVGDEVYIDEMRHFIQRVESNFYGRTMAATLDDGIKVLEVCQQVRAC